MMWVSTASRSRRKPASSECSQTGLSQVDQRLAAPDVVDQHVEPALLGVDPLHQVAHLLGFQVVDRDGDTPPPAAVTSSAVSSMVSGRSISERPARVLRPVA